MAEKLSQVYIDNPITTLPDDGLLYVAKSPYGVAASQCAIKSQDIFPASGVVTDGALTAFNGTSGKKLKTIGAMTTGQIAGGVTAGSAKPFTLTAGTNITSIVTDTGASTMTINAASQGGNVTINGDSGSATGATITLSTAKNIGNCGYTVGFDAGGSTIELNCIDGNGNISWGYGAGSPTRTGLWGLDLGYNAGSAQTGGESSNINIQNDGVSEQSHVLRIGSYGTDDRQQSIAYVAGLNTVTSITTNTTIPNTIGGTPAPLRTYIIDDEGVTLELPSTPLDGEPFRIINRDLSLTGVISGNGNKFVGTFYDQGMVVGFGTFISVSNVTSADNITSIVPSTTIAANQYVDLVAIGGQYFTTGSMCFGQP